MKPENTSINISEVAANVINALRHKAGTFSLYDDTLARLYTTVLYESDELGMSDTETVSTLRTLDLIRRDLAAIAAPETVSPPEAGDAPDDTARKVNEAFNDFGRNAPVKDDESILRRAEEALAAIDTALSAVCDAKTTACAAGESYRDTRKLLRHICDNISDVRADLEAVRDNDGII